MEVVRCGCSAPDDVAVAGWVDASHALFEAAQQAGHHEGNLRGGGGRVGGLGGVRGMWAGPRVDERSAGR